MVICVSTRTQEDDVDALACKLLSHLLPGGPCAVIGVVDSHLDVPNETQKHSKWKAEADLPAAIEKVDDELLAGGFDLIS